MPDQPPRQQWPIKREKRFPDGAKIETNADQCTFTRKKNVAEYEGKRNEKMGLPLKEMDEIKQKRRSEAIFGSNKGCGAFRRFRWRESEKVKIQR